MGHGQGAVRHPVRRALPDHLNRRCSTHGPHTEILTVPAEIKATHPEARDLEVWFLDEARVGQTGRTCRRWFEKGIRPRGRRDLRHEAVYLFGAVCPERDHGVALVLPEVSAAAMQAMLDELGPAVTPGTHAVVILDRAGWHTPKS